MSDLKSNIAKGLIAALCSIMAMVAGAASARQETQNIPTHLLSSSETSASRVL